MDNKILDGMKFGFGFIFAIGLVLGIAYAGYHGANQVISGTFWGDYAFNGTVNFTDATVIGIPDLNCEGTSCNLRDNTLNCEAVMTDASGYLACATGIDGTEIQDGGVGEVDIAQNTLDDSEIQDNSLTAGSLAANSVGSSEIATGGVIESDILQNTLDDSEIQDNSLTASSLAANSVGDSEMIDSPTFSTVYTSNWFRSTGSTGWYSQTYGGGWYMIDTTYLRAYNNKVIYTGGNIQAGGSFIGIEPYSTRQTASCSTSGCTATATCPAGYKVVAGDVARDTVNCIYGAKWCERYCTPGLTSCSATALASQASVNIFCMRIY